MANPAPIATKTPDVLGRNVEVVPDGDEAAAYAWCTRLARSHYENFPVGSLLIPQRLRDHVVAIYAFARIADDLADEPGLEPEDRLAALDEWERKLRDAWDGVASEPVFVALRASARDMALPLKPLLDLLNAFRHDAVETGYADVDELLAYCRSSANPVGRLILHLHGLTSAECAAWSDDICTALQITNFLQDLSVDLPRGHVTIPRSLLDGADPPGVASGEQLAPALAQLVELAAARYRSGRALLERVPAGRLRLELRLTWLGGMAILDRVRSAGVSVLQQRPKLGTRDRVGLLARAVTGIGVG